MRAEADQGLRVDATMHGADAITLIRAGEQGSSELRRVDGATVVVEVARTTYYGACAADAVETLRFVWDPATGSGNPSTMVPTSAARTVVGAQVGRVTSYENVVPGLTIFVSGANADGPFRVTFARGADTTSLTCNTVCTLRCG